MYRGEQAKLKMRSVIFAIFFAVFSREAGCVVITNLINYCTGTDNSPCRCSGLNFGGFNDGDVEIESSTKFSCQSFIYTNSTFSTIPRNAFRISEPVVYLNMTNCSLRRIHKWNFYSGHSDAPTSELFLEHNLIEIVPSEVFEYLPNLKTLKLDNNQISILEVNCFKGLKKLLYLWLRKNHIQALREDTLDELTNLYHIDLRENGLQFLPGNIFKNNRKVWQINLEDNQLKIIDINIIRSSTVLQFMLAHFNESVQATPVSIFDVPSVKKVFVDRNYFPYISSTWRPNLTKQYEFSASGANLTYIEDGAFSNMPNLMRLYLQDNLLETFDLSLVSNLKHLRALYINNNRLKVIDYSLLMDPPKPDLEFVGLEDNPFSCDQRSDLMQYLKKAKVQSDLIERSCTDIPSTPSWEDPTVDPSCKPDYTVFTILVLTNLVAALINLCGFAFLLWSYLKGRSKAARNFEETNVSVKLAET